MTMLRVRVGVVVVILAAASQHAAVTAVAEAPSKSAAVAAPEEAAPAARARVRGAVNSAWTPMTRAGSTHGTTATFSLTAVLRVDDQDGLAAHALAVSSPGSPLYGHYLDSGAAAVADAHGPAITVGRCAVSALAALGATHIRNRRHDVTFRMEPKHAEASFGGEAWILRHLPSNETTLALVDGGAAGPALEMPATLRACGVDVVMGVLPGPPRRVHARRATNEQACMHKGIVVPYTYRQANGVPISWGASAARSQHVVQFAPEDGFSMLDVSRFNKDNGAPTVTNVTLLGDALPLSPFPADEGSLDIDIVSTLAPGATNAYSAWQGWMYDVASTLLADSHSPDVTSISWGADELAQCDKDAPSLSECKSVGGGDVATYVRIINTLFQKLALQGKTVVAASGDVGVGCVNTTTGGAARFFTSFPASSPWVVSVGGTMFAAAPASRSGAPRAADETGAVPPICVNATVPCANVTTQVAAQYPDSSITTGGGFSALSARPHFQNAVVSAWLKRAAVSGTLPPSTLYNSSNRAMPDVSLLAQCVSFVSTGLPGAADGTSAAAPAFAAMVTLMNEQLVAAGKPRVGFAAPALYAAAAARPAAFTTVSAGSNNCTTSACCKYGFTSSPDGFDAVTGLGVPIVRELVAYLKDVPPR